MKVDVFSSQGGKDSKVDLPKEIFSQSFNQDLIHQLLTTYISNSHQGTKGQKNRSSARGGGRKPWKQKGTGRARAGTIRSPIWRGGGVTFAHTYREIKKKKINKKMFRAAMRSLLSKLVEEKRIIVIDNLEISEPVKTLQVKQLLNSLKLSKAVFLILEPNSSLALASKNLPQVNIQTIHSIDPPALINSEKVVITRDALTALKDSLKNN